MGGCETSLRNGQGACIAPQMKDETTKNGIPLPDNGATVPTSRGGKRGELKAAGMCSLTRVFHKIMFELTDLEKLLATCQAAARGQN